MAAQAGSEKIDYKGIMPVKITGKANGGFVSIDQLNRFTKNIDFGSINSVFTAEKTGEQAVIASVSDVPIITIKPSGSGKIIYYGISEENEFKFSPHYPIFWTEFIKFLTGQADVKNLNFKTGDILLLENERIIKTVLGSVKK